MKTEGSLSREIEVPCLREGKLVRIDYMPSGKVVYNLLWTSGVSRTCLPLTEGEFAGLLAACKQVAELPPPTWPNL